MEFKEIERELRLILSSKRYEHSVGVAKAAVSLAKIYKVDQEKAYLAGLMHDCAKELNISYQLVLAMQSKVGFDISQIPYPPIYHGPAGSVYAVKKFSVEDEDVLRAVALHILGDIGMSSLEKIIFVSDYFEENRKYPCKEEIKAAAFQSLDKAMILGCDVSINYLLSAGKKVHHKMIKIREYYIEKYKEEKHC